MNVALASNGGRAVDNGLWRDNTYQSFHDWIEVDFDGSKTISELDVSTVQDNYSNPVEPTESMTFSVYGLTASEVQYWNGTAWTDAGRKHHWE